MVGCSNSCSTNCSGDSALTSSSRRPALVRRQQRAPLLRRQRRRAALGRQDVAHDRHELVVPAPQRVGVAAAEGGERCDRLVRIGPPFQRASVAGEQRDVEFGLDVTGAVPFELEIAVPRHRGDGALEEGVGVVQEAGMARVFQRAQSAARDRPAIDRQRLQAGLAEIGLQDEAVVPGAEDDAVIGGGHGLSVTLTRVPGRAKRDPGPRGQIREAWC